MIESVLLAKIMGSYLLIISIVMLARPKRFVQMVDEIVECPSAIDFSMFLFIVFGLIIVFTHNVWVLDWPVFITILGWLLLFKWVSYLVFPAHFLALCDKVNNKNYYLLSGALTFVLSLFLLCKGFSG